MGKHSITRREFLAYGGAICSVPLISCTNRGNEVLPTWKHETAYCISYRKKCYRKRGGNKKAAKVFAHRYEYRDSKALYEDIAKPGNEYVLHTTFDVVRVTLSAEVYHARYVAPDKKVFDRDNP